MKARGENAGRNSARNGVKNSGNIAAGKADTAIHITPRSSLVTGRPIITTNMQSHTVMDPNTVTIRINGRFTNIDTTPTKTRIEARRRGSRVSRPGLKRAISRALGSATAALCQRSSLIRRRRPLAPVAVHLEHGALAHEAGYFLDAGCRAPHAPPRQPADDSLKLELPVVHTVQACQRRPLRRAGGSGRGRRPAPAGIAWWERRARLPASRASNVSLKPHFVPHLCPICHTGERSHS
jgi:hypothetical protein